MGKSAKNISRRTDQGSTTFKVEQKLKEKERLLEFLRKLCDAVKDKNILPEYIYKEITNE